MGGVVDEQLLQELATSPGLFHVGADGQLLARALTQEPLEALRDVLSPGMRTLETGCGGAFCADHDISLESVDFLLGSSDVVLPGWNESLDLVLVDGAHRMPYPFIDWHYVAGPLQVGGKFLLDDVPIPTVHLLYEFLQREAEWQLEEIYGDKLAVFTKVAQPPDDATRDWELQSFNLPWRYGHVPWTRRWRTLRDEAMIGTRLRRRRSRR
jgi:hypothetical protein